MFKHKDQRNEIADEQLIELYWQRNEEAMIETDRKYGKLLFSIAYNILRNKCDCEECQNDTYIAAWNAIPPARPTSFVAFIVQIIRRIAINRFKMENRKKRIPSKVIVSLDDMNEIVHDDNSVEKEYEAKEVGRLINNYVKNLSDRQKYIFLERFYFIETVKDIARDLDISVPTVYREIEELKKDLKQYLERNGVYI